MNARNRIARGLPLAIGLALMVAAPAHAQAPAAAQPAAAGPQAPLKVGVINGERVLSESSIGQQVQQEATAMANDWDGRVRAKQEEIDTLVQQGQEQRLTLNQEALDRLNGQIEQLQVELGRMRDDAQRAIQRFGAEAQARINERLIPAVDQLATAEGFDLILDTRMEGILYFADAIDATDRFIAMVNAQGAPTPQR